MWVATAGSPLHQARLCRLQAGSGGASCRMAGGWGPSDGLSPPDHPVLSGFSVTFWRCPFPQAQGQGWWCRVVVNPGRGKGLKTLSAGLLPPALQARSLGAAPKRWGTPRSHGVVCAELQGSQQSQEMPRARCHQQCARQHPPLPLTPSRAHQGQSAPGVQWVGSLRAGSVIPKGNVTGLSVLLVAVTKLGGDGGWRRHWGLSPYVSCTTWQTL